MSASLATVLTYAPRPRSRVDDETLGSEDAARYLNMSRSSLLRSAIPYAATPGGSERRGRRRYRIADLDDYLAARGAPRTSLVDRVTQLERRVDRLDGGAPD